MKRLQECSIQHGVVNLDWVANRPIRNERVWLQRARASATGLVFAIGCLSVGAASTPAAADHVIVHTPVSVGECLHATLLVLGGAATHLEFESRNGRPIYEFVVVSGGVTYYVGCDATTGVLQDIDIIVQPGDERFLALAQFDEAHARATALAQYPGEIEEVKWVLTSRGNAWYEVDIELEGTEGELNVWVDAETGRIVRVDVEYWEIGAREGVNDVDDDD
jgi:uncharacterized membrane protein YkoI